MWNAPAPLRFWHLASLDAPTVALVWSSAFAWAAHARLPAWAPILLALATWAIYIGDRLLDARAGLRTPPLHTLRDRHYFHWRHRRMLAALGVGAALAGVLIVTSCLPVGARVPDSALAAATLAYFSRVHSRRSFPLPLSRLRSVLSCRAVLIGVLFTAGCLLPLGSQMSVGWQTCALAAFFAVLAWLNCHAIENWEADPSCTRPHRISGMACVVALAGVCCAIMMIRLESRWSALVLAGAGSSLLLALLDRSRDRLAPVALRAAADFVLLTPALLIVPWGPSR